MSVWSFVKGVITVEPMGRTQAEKTYILQTVLDHLPIVSGSEGDMNVYMIQKNGYNSSRSCDEHGNRTNNLIDDHGHKSQRRGWLNSQNQYLLIVDGSLRYREFEETFKEFQNWLCRLAKRVDVRDVLVEVKSYKKSFIIRNTNHVYTHMFEKPSWCNESGEPTWCEYLMWDCAKDSSYPILLAYKYFEDEDNDQEAKRRIDYFRKG